jgi:hypothetical protein
VVWRKLRRLGVAQLADGLVALPADARTREQLEWIADEVREADGTAGVWLAQPSSLALERETAAAMAAARADEYSTLHNEIVAAAALPDADRFRALRRHREQLRRIRRRDFFPPPEREAVTAALNQLAAIAPAAGTRPALADSRDTVSGRP